MTKQFTGTPIRKASVRNSSGFRKLPIGTSTRPAPGIGAPLTSTRVTDDAPPRRDVYPRGR